MTKSTERELLRARAQHYAHSELVARHREEYEQLYQFYCEHLGVGDDQRRVNGGRPKAPPYKGGLLQQQKGTPDAHL